MKTAEGERVQYTLIRDLPAAERPRERLRDYGAGALSTAELLAIVLRTGTARESVLSLASRLLWRYAGLLGLARAAFAELCRERGLGEAKAAQLQAAFELGKRLAASGPEERPLVRTPADVANLLMADMMLLEQESLRVVLLNTKNHVLGVHEVYRGSVNSSLVRVSELFREAIRQNCPAFILVHNHPSGDPAPSPDDISMTRQALEAAKVLDIEVLDHVVIGQQRWVSLREKGLAFK